MREKLIQPTRLVTKLEGQELRRSSALYMLTIYFSPKNVSFASVWIISTEKMCTQYLS